MNDLTLKQLVALVLEQAKAKGFGVTAEEVNIPTKISLIHSEISEAFEAYRHNNINGRHGLKEELGDAIQRILHICGVLRIDIEEEILKKIELNKERVWDWDQMNEKHS